VGIGTATPTSTLDVCLFTIILWFVSGGSYFFQIAAPSADATIRVTSTGSLGGTSQSLQFGTNVNGQYQPGASIRFSAGQVPSTGRRLREINSGTQMDVDADFLTVNSFTTRQEADVASLHVCMLFGICLCAYVY